MGKMLNMNQIVSKNIEQHTSRINSIYNKQLGEKFVTTTWFHQNKLVSTEDLGLRNVNELIGPNSPIKYDRIENVPVYGVGELALQIQNGDFGLDTGVSGTGTVIPDTIKPLPNDFFFFNDRLGKSYLFRVMGVTNDRLDHGQFYQFNFELERIGDSAELIDAQVEQNYVMVYDNIGTKNNAIIEKDEYFTVQYLENLSESLILKYRDFFFDKRTNSIILDDIPMNNELEINKYLYDPYLTEFIIRNNVFELKDTFFNITQLQRHLNFDKFKILNYEKTIYFALEKGIFEDDVRNKVQLMPLNKSNTPFQFNMKTYHQAFYSMCKEKCNDELSCYILFQPQFIIGLKFSKEDCPTNIFEKVIYYFFTNDATDLKELETLLDEVNDSNFYPEYKEFFLLPVIIFIFKALINKFSYKLKN